MTIGALCLGVAALTVPGASAGHGGGHGLGAAAKECKKMKKADRAAFKATYGKRAMRSCIRGNPVDTDETTPREFRNAARECRAERREDPEGFRETYGTNHNKRNAMGKCVSGKVRDREPGPPAAA